MSQVQSFLKARSCRLLLGSGIVLLVTACSWTEPARVEEDFGRSVRNMVAEQIFDPATARTPSTGVPGIDGTAASAAVAGYGKAAGEARVERVKQDGSPIPVVGIISEPPEE